MIKSLFSVFLLLILVTPILAVERPALKRAENAAQNLEARRAEAKAKLDERQQEFKKAVEDRMAKAKETIEKRQTAFKEKAAKIKDEKKRQAVERINTQVGELNQRRVSHFSQIIDKLEQALEKVRARSDKASANGLDISAVTSAIASAESAIAAAREAVQAQAGKSYTILIGEETALKQDVGKTRQALHTDLNAAREKVKSAHEVVRKAAVALAQIPRVNEVEAPEPAPAETNQ